MGRWELEVSQEPGTRGQGSEGTRGPPLWRVTGLGCAGRCRQPGALSLAAAPKPQGERCFYEPG